MATRTTLTPMMQQYHRIKEEHQDSILFFRLGDFYEMFEDDALEVSQLLNLTLTKRNEIPMCGIPYHAAKTYIKRLLDEGKKIAICEQTELPPSGKGIAKREVVQIITPATVVEDDYLQSEQDSFILALTLTDEGVAASWADISSGQFFLRLLAPDPRYIGVLSLLEEIRPTEILVNEDDYFLHTPFAQLLDTARSMVTKLPSWHFGSQRAYTLMTEQAGTASLKGFGLAKNDTVIASAGALLTYLKESARTTLSQIDTYTLIEEQNYMAIDEASRKSLELFANLNDGSAHYTLFKAIDQTLTSMGTRKLKRWLASPLTEVEAILLRQGWVAFFYESRDELSRIRGHLKSVLDLERLLSRIVMNRHQSRDIVGVSATIATLFLILEERYQSLLPADFSQENLDRLLTLAQTIDASIKPTWQGAFEEGKVILDGYDETLDQLRSVKDGGKELLNAYLTEVRKETGITTLKLGSNKILGYYLEVTKAQANRIPSSFYRKQTLVNGERFTSDELIELEKRILGGASMAESRERIVYEEISEMVRKTQDELLVVSALLSDLDALQSMAYCAVVRDYTKPIFTEEDGIELIESRHPVVEQYLEVGSFVPNDLVIKSGGERFCLITGPNMAGKSTFLRQTALIAILAQMGSFVPAKQATLSIIDSLYCRVGASDNLARGESTFLVEMQEAAHILNTATRRSLVIVDELGRGTSTQDGMAIAYAIMQSLLGLESKTLFATHYHELARTDTSAIQLLTLQVAQQGGKIRFLRRVVEGIANSSYGLNVARMAGISTEIIRTARRFQSQHFAHYELSDVQGDLFTNTVDERYESESEMEVIEQIRSFEVDTSSPLDALLLLRQLKQILEEEHPV